MENGLYISTDMVDRSDRVDFWRETSSLLYDVTPCNAQDKVELSGSVKSRLFGSLVLGNTSFNTQYCQRTPGLIARTDLDFYLLQLVLAGEYRGDFAGKNLYARPGDMFILDLTKPLNSKKEAGARITLVIPRNDISSSLAMKNLHGLVLNGRTPANRLLFEFIVSLDTLLDKLEAHALPSVQESLMLLLNAALTGTNLTHEQYLSVNLSLRQRVLQYIERNLTDPELGPKAIMAYFRLSHSHLYRAFELEKGVARLIRDKRLDLAYRMILQKKGQPLSLKELAYQCGFSNRAPFSRYFYERFNVAPKELRSLQETLPRGRPSAILFHRYIAARIPPPAE